MTSTPTRPPAAAVAPGGHARSARVLAALAALAPWVLTILLLSGAEPSAKDRTPSVRAPFALEREVAAALRAGEDAPARIAQVDIDPAGVSVAAATPGSPRAFGRSRVLGTAIDALRAVGRRDPAGCVAGMTLRHRRSGTLTWFVRGRRAGRGWSWTVDVATGTIRAGAAATPVGGASCGAPALG